MMKTLCFAIVLLAAALLSGCSRPGCSQRAGRAQRLPRTVNTFSHLVIQDNINVVLTQGDSCSVDIETDESLQPVILAEVHGQQLHLRNAASCSWIRRPGESITAYVTLPDLNRVDYQGSGNVTCTDTLHLDYLSVEATNGAGTVRLLLDTRFTLAYVNNEVADLVFAGRSDSAYAYSASRGGIDFRDFEVKRLGAAFASARDGYVWATESLQATLFNAGNLYYRGTPARIVTDYRSSGRVAPLR
ncbi:GIN domain-containing protein [Flaviaesturariibacter amylovorans]|uniref:Putative auto-transporter adhesin head GIN domain-containing protein n=1 Tax=Flaviaesturariibacter amylovorans TaxID=1084520 RepID=A0ABP8GMR2_9BACT